MREKQDWKQRGACTKDQGPKGGKTSNEDRTQGKRKDEGKGSHSIP